MKLNEIMECLYACGYSIFEDSKKECNQVEQKKIIKVIKKCKAQEDLMDRLWGIKKDFNK